MLACCGRPPSRDFCDPCPYIDPRYARETIAESCSIRVALATAIIARNRLLARARRARDVDKYFRTFLAVETLEPVADEPVERNGFHPTR